MSSTDTAASAEDTIREYLAARAHPGHTAGLARVAELHRALEATQEPLERLKLRCAIEDAGRYLERLEERFVAVVRSWSEAEGLRPEVWEPEPIPREVLRRAGLLGGGGVRRVRRRRRATTVVDRVLELSNDRQPFSVAEMVVRAEAEDVSVRWAVKALISRGVLVERPSERGADGRERKMYQRRGE